MASNQLSWYCIIISALFVVHMSVSASNTSCPTWFYFNNTIQQCECGKQFGALLCNQQEKSVEIVHGYCVTYSGQEGLFYAGLCPFTPTKNSVNRLFSELPGDPDLLNDAMCGPYNRNGLLCGRCINGYGPAVFSFDRKCADCSEHSTGYAIVLYLSLKLIPITLFFMCVLFFRLDITAGPLLGYVLFCQVYLITLQNELYIYEYINLHVSEAGKILFKSSLTISELWILQYFRFVIPSLCLSTKLTSIHIEVLNLATAIYPIVIVVIICISMELHARNYRIIHILWKPISIPLKKLNITSVTGDAIIHTFATFILLSAFSLTYNASAFYTKHNVHRSIDDSLYKCVLYYDPTITWLSRSHIVYAITGLVLFILLILIPSLLLCVYPTRIYGHLSQYISIRKRLAITAFTEALQNCFKDGLNGTRDYRALAALLIIGPTLGAVVGCILRLAPVSDNTPSLTCGVAFFLFSSFISYVKPCKSTIANLSLIYHTILAGILSIALYLWNNHLAIGTPPLKWTIISAPMISHVLVLMWVGYRIVSYFRYRFNPPDCKVALTKLVNILKCFQRRQSGYQALSDAATQ